MEASVPNIRNSASPGDAIRRLLENLEAQALSSGRYHVVLFDEGDQLFAPFSAQQRDHRREVHTQTSDRRSQETSTFTTTETSAIDLVGQEMLASLKAALGRDLTRVFVIVTTNRSQIPPELSRDGRLKKIEFSAIGLQTFEHLEDSVTICPQYDDLRRVAPLLVQLMNARHVRMHGSQSQVLLELERQVVKLFLELPPFETYKDKTRQIGGGIYQQSRNIAPAENQVRLTKFLEFVGFPIDFSTPAYHRTQGLEFHGYFTGHGRVVGWSRSAERDDPESGSIFGVPAYIRHLRNLVPSAVSGYYQDNAQEFGNIDDAKKALARLIFPNLEHYGEYMRLRTIVAGKAIG